MENKLLITTNNQLIMPASSEVLLAKKSKKLNDCSDAEIKQAISYILRLIGCPDNSVPQEDAKLVLINTLKKTFCKLAIEELKLSFDNAIAKKFEADINLYGEVFSSKYIAQVLHKYIFWRDNLIKPKEDGMTNHERFSRTIDLLKSNPASNELLKQIGSIKSEDIKEEKSIDHILYQKWFNQFLNLEKKQGTPGSIFRYGKNIDCIQYCEYKIQQLERVKLLLKNRNKTNK